MRGREDLDPLLHGEVALVVHVHVIKVDPKVNIAPTKANATAQVEQTY